MSFIDRLLGRADPREALKPLYRAVVERARAPHWYLDGGVADTIDGRFDMIAALLSLVLIRLERDEARAESALLTELFVDDMDAQLRQIGVGEFAVGKHIGRMMSALGGRLQAYRDALGEGRDLEGALARNLYRGEPPTPDQLAHVATELRRLHAGLSGVAIGDLIAGRLPR